MQRPFYGMGIVALLAEYERAVADGRVVLGVDLALSNETPVTLELRDFRHFVNEADPPPPSRGPRSRRKWPVRR